MAAEVRRDCTRDRQAQGPARQAQSDRDNGARVRGGHAPARARRSSSASSGPARSSSAAADADVRLQQLPRPHAANPTVVAAAREALLEYGTGTTGSRTANGTLSLHEELEREFADWFGKRHALIFSTGYQANLSLIGGLCGPDDVILIDSDSHASIYDATRQTASQVVAFRHNSPESLRKKLERLPEGPAQPPGRRRRAVFDSRRRGAAARDRRRLPRARRVSAGRRSAFARHLSARPASAAPRRRASSIRSTSSSARSRSRWPASAASACRITRSCARCISWRARTCSRRRARRRTSRACGRPCASFASIRSCASGCGRTSGACATACRSCGYVIGSTESPIVPIFTGEERAHDRALAGTAGRRALREPDRAARLPARRLPAARQLLGGAHAAADYARRSTSSSASRVGVGVTA